MYEYSTQEFTGDDPGDVLAWLNACGEEGWEAFTMESLAGGGHRVWLKRQRSNVSGGLERAERTGLR